MSLSQGPPEINWPEGISEAEKEELREVLLAFDAAAGDLARDHTVIFPSEEDRLRLFHAAQERWLRAWSKPGPCMHPGCTSQSIPRSHSIPMSTSLKEIAEQGHVVTPRLGKEGLEVARVGIREASTFPGFCDAHEAQFTSFESQKRMTTADHFALQAFRTICREIYAKRHYVQKLQNGLDDYRKLRDAFIKARVGRVRSAKPIDVGDVTIKNDPIEDRGVNQTTESSRALIELQSLYQGVLDELKAGAGNVAMLVRKIDLKFPVCLSGVGGINYQWEGKARHGICVLAVIPEATATNFIIGGEKVHADFLDLYMGDETSTAMLGRVESWMCHGSDHWFMTPSAWQAIPQVRKDAICARILDDANSFAHPVEFSVLDGVRKQILALAEQLIAHEQAKLNWVGPRTPD